MRERLPVGEGLALEEQALLAYRHTFTLKDLLLKGQDGHRGLHLKLLRGDLRPLKEHFVHTASQS